MFHGYTQGLPMPYQDIGPGGVEKAKGKDLLNLPESSRTGMVPES